MVETETTTTSTGTSRLITFEIDGDERLVIGAGRGELDNRIIFDSDYVEGRYAVVPVDELVKDQTDPENIDENLKLEGMSILGDIAYLPTDKEQHVALYKGGEQVTEFDSKGAYGLIWVPYE